MKHLYWIALLAILAFFMFYRGVKTDPTQLQSGADSMLYSLKNSDFQSNYQPSNAYQRKNMGKHHVVSGVVILVLVLLLWKTENVNGIIQNVLGSGQGSF